MYHTKQINQVKQKEKSFLTTSFALKDLQKDYTITYTRADHVIFQELLPFVNAPYIYLKNDYLSLRTGYSHKTITRATNKFLKDGLITKHQKNKYAPNRYTFTNKVKKITFSHWINSLSTNNQDLFITHGIRIDHKNRIIYSLGNVPQNKNLLLDKYLFRNLSPSSREGRVLKNIKDTPRRRWDPQKGMKVYNFQDKPSVIAKPKEKKVLKPQISVEDRRKELENMVERCRIHLAEPKKYFRFGLHESIKYTETHLQRCLDDLMELNHSNPGSSNEKQSLLYQHSTHSMESGGAQS